MRSKMMKASLAIAAATSLGTIAVDTATAAGKVKVVHCQSAGKEFYLKFQAIPDAFKGECKIKITDGLGAGKIKFANNDYFLKINKD